MQSFPPDDKSAPEPARKYEIGKVWRAATLVARELLGVRRPAKAATIVTQRVKPVTLHKLWWNVAVTGMVTALVIAACWIVYERHPASPVGTSSSIQIQRSNAVQQIPFVSAKPTPSNSAPKTQTAEVGMEEGNVPSSASKRIRVGPNEVDYIVEDVTIRHFRTKPALQQVHGEYGEVHFGEDVTVRHFASRLARARGGMATPF
jgi:hypothetical protein